MYKSLLTFQYDCQKTLLQSEKVCVTFTGKLATCPLAKSPVTCVLCQAMLISRFVIAFYGTMFHFDREICFSVDTPRQFFFANQRKEAAIVEIERGWKIELTAPEVDALSHWHTKSQGFLRLKFNEPLVKVVLIFKVIFNSFLYKLSTKIGIFFL